MQNSKRFCCKRSLLIKQTACLVLAILATSVGVPVQANVEQDKIARIEKYCAKSILKIVLQGDALVEAENYQAAIKSYTSAIAIEPKAYYVYARRADAYALDHKQSLALADWNKCISMMSTVPVYFLSRGRLNDNMGRDAEALKDYEHAIAAGLTAPQKDAARVCERMGKLDKSIEYLSSYISHQRSLERIPFLFDRARVYTKLGKSALAAQDKATASKLLKECGTDNIDSYPTIVKSRN